VFNNQPHRPFPDFRGIAFVSVHYSILSRFGVSGKPGAIHPARGKECFYIYQLTMENTILR
jgi:hypothetical protein